ncbi:MarR family winged helix-turn-helix transcriptional regulator [Lactobacillus delbrueckii]|uniref:MarR family winged helix-turn-helix transcriptional regulator n=1 Tax=Lactobacillus delbrueckii TaxID=1584 RepID=UPI0027E34217|nr:MarR family winged helix-turn-helix transcriptional regulator [Lactobacillus delbrueckii]
MAEEELNEELFYRSMCLQRQLAQMGMRYEKLHVGVRGQNRTFALLSKNEGMKQVELARFARVRPSSISEVVDRLERHGLIEQHRDNSDHRVFRLYLTEKGREQNKRNHSSWLGFVGDLMGPLSDDDLDHEHDCPQGPEAVWPPAREAGQDRRAGGRNLCRGRHRPRFWPGRK